MSITGKMRRTSVPCTRPAPSCSKVSATGAAAAIEPRGRALLAVSAVKLSAGYFPGIPGSAPAERIAKQEAGSQADIIMAPLDGRSRVRQLATTKFTEQHHHVLTDEDAHSASLNKRFADGSTVAERRDMVVALRNYSVRIILAQPCLFKGRFQRLRQEGARSTEGAPPLASHTIPSLLVRVGSGNFLTATPMIHNIHTP